MRLTKLQRYTAYCIMLAEKDKLYNDGFVVAGFCYLWNHISGMLDVVISETLPELYIKRTRDNSHIWFNSKEERIAALKQCIKETEPK